MKRPRGSGTIRYEPSRGRYVAVLKVGGVAHKRTLTAPESSEPAKRKIEKLLNEMRRQYGVASPTRHTLSGFLEQWLEYMEPRVAFLTLKSHRSRIHAHIAPALGHVPVAELTPLQVDTLLTKLSRDKSAVTVQHVRKTLHAALNHAVRWQMIERNPVSLTSAPRAPHVPRRTLTADEALKFLEFVQGDRLEALWNIAACLGLRSGEVRGLTWEAVEFRAAGQGTLGAPATLAAAPGLDTLALTDHPRRSVRTPSPATHILHVTQSLGYSPGMWELHEPKTKSSVRHLPLPRFIADLLEQRRDAQRFESRELGYANPMGLVFTQPDGYPLHSQVINDRLAVILAEAGLPKIATHDLRHCAASLLIAKGVPVRAVQAILGHATSRLTMETYAHSDDGQHAEAARTLESWRAQ